MQATSTSPKKPSPLSYSSPRGSPFKRPESPLASSPSTVRPATPQRIVATKSAIFSPHDPSANSFAPPSDNAPSKSLQFGRAATGGDPLSKLNPARVHEMRESFQVLDRDDDGQVTQEDVQQMLTDLGQDSSPHSLSLFFPASNTTTPQPLNLSTYLHILSSLLAPLSSPAELAAAFAAFDVDDSGQVDVDELREALLHTNRQSGDDNLKESEINAVMAEFSSRRVLARRMGKEAGNRGEIFRYHDFVAGITGPTKLEASGQAQAEVPVA